MLFLDLARGTCVGPLNHHASRMSRHQVTDTCKFTKTKRKKWKVKINSNLGEPLVLAHSKPGCSKRKANLLLYPEYQEYATLWLDLCTAWSVSTAKNSQQHKHMQIGWKFIPLDVSFGNTMCLGFFGTKRGRWLVSEVTAWIQFWIFVFGLDYSSDPQENFMKLSFPFCFWKLSFTIAVGQHSMGINTPGFTGFFATNPSSKQLML